MIQEVSDSIVQRVVLGVAPQLLVQKVCELPPEMGGNFML